MEAQKGQVRVLQGGYMHHFSWLGAMHFSFFFVVLLFENIIN